MDVLEFHAFVDPLDGRPGEDDSGLCHLDRCHAALVALRSRLAPRLRRAAWHREPLALWVWDPSDRATQRGTCWTAEGERAMAEAHIWGRVDVGESMDDEWFIIGLLLAAAPWSP